MQNTIIRTATAKDMEVVHKLIRELAIYEKAEEQHTNSVEQLILPNVAPIFIEEL